MPTRNRRPCTVPGCSALVNKGRCGKHRTRPTAHSRGYDSRWRKIRRLQLHRSPLCELRIKCDGAVATQVDHILPLANGGTHASSNLRSVCHSCHSYRTARDQSGWL